MQLHWRLCEMLRYYSYELQRWHNNVYSNQFIWFLNTIRMWPFSLWNQQEVFVGSRLGHMAKSFESRVQLYFLPWSPEDSLRFPFMINALKKTPYSFVLLCISHHNRFLWSVSLTQTYFHVPVLDPSKQKRTDIKSCFMFLISECKNKQSKEAFCVVTPTVDTSGIFSAVGMVRLNPLRPHKMSGWTIPMWEYINCCLF